MPNSFHVNEETSCGYVKLRGWMQRTGIEVLNIAQGPFAGNHRGFAEYPRTGNRAYRCRRAHLGLHDPENYIDHRVSHYRATRQLGKHRHCGNRPVEQVSSVEFPSLDLFTVTSCECNGQNAITQWHRRLQMTLPQIARK